MKALDLFCGLGGWSDGLSVEGFEILGVEINPEIAALYKHQVIIEDVRNLDGKEFKGYDLIVGSPPCRDFSEIARVFGHRWKKPPNPERGLTMVHAFLRIVEEAKPTYWLMENVPNLNKFLDLKPKVETHIAPSMKRCFWGDFPFFLITQDHSKFRFLKRTKKGMRRAVYVGKHEQWKRAKIPLPVARALGRAVREAINND